MNFIIFIFICYGMTQIVSLGKIFEPVRKKLGWHFLQCPMCIGFHIGVLVFLGFWFSGIILFPNLYLGSFFFGCISSAVSFIIISIIKDDGFHINIG